MRARTLEDACVIASATSRRDLCEACECDELIEGAKLSRSLWTNAAHSQKTDRAPVIRVLSQKQNVVFLFSCVALAWRRKWRAKSRPPCRHSKKQMRRSPPLAGRQQARFSLTHDAGQKKERDWPE